MKKPLDKDDRWAILRSTVNHIVNNNLSKDDICSTDDFLEQIVPGIAWYNTDWEGIKTIKNLKSSEVLKGVKQHLRNLK